MLDSGAFCSINPARLGIYADWLLRYGFEKLLSAGDANDEMLLPTALIPMFSGVLSSV